MLADAHGGGETDYPGRDFSGSAARRPGRQRRRDPGLFAAVPPDRDPARHSIEATGVRQASARSTPQKAQRVNVVGPTPGSEVALNGMAHGAAGSRLCFDVAGLGNRMRGIRKRGNRMYRLRERHLRRRTQQLARPARRPSGLAVQVVLRSSRHRVGPGGDDDTFQRLSGEAINSDIRLKGPRRRGTRMAQPHRYAVLRHAGQHRIPLGSRPLPQVETIFVSRPPSGCWRWSKLPPRAVTIGGPAEPAASTSACSVASRASATPRCGDLSRRFPTS